MKSLNLADQQHLSGTRKPGWLDSLAVRLVLKKMQQIEAGALTIVDGDQMIHFGQKAEAATLKCTLTVHDISFYADIAFGGSIGAGEAYMRGAWTCDDPVALVRILLQNRHVLDGMEKGLARLTAPVQKAFHWVNRNTREGARRNISAHYDLGNEFFRLWLDDSMMYSSAIFPDPAMSLADAQQHRLDVICRKLNLCSNDHVIEIGTGWGGFSIYAAQHYGCRVTTTTISQEQYEFARQRVADVGMEDHVTVLFEDYRDLKGTFDKLVSIEMIEAIGTSQYDTYFAKCSELLKPGGRLLIQAITIADRQYDYARKNVDFIQRYIFPGADLPSLSVMVNSIVSVSDMLVTGVDDIGRDYAMTLNHWRRNFFEKIDAVRALKYPEEFIRMWDFYLVYCEGGFIERAISDVHLQAKKPA